MTSFNIWHFVVLFLTIVMFAGGIYQTIKSANEKTKIPMLISVTLISFLIGGFAFVVVDKYTKEPKLYKLKSKRLLNIEKVVYTGIVKNEGNYEIGEVTFELKLVNKGLEAGNVKAGSFFQVSGFAEFFGQGAGILYKPQTIIKKFIVAKNLKPGEAQSFRVYFDYPPYLKSVSQFTKVYGH
jgi:hypothetical protein